MRQRNEVNSPAAATPTSVIPCPKGPYYVEVLRNTHHKNCAVELHAHIVCESLLDELSEEELARCLETDTIWRYIIGHRDGPGFWQLSAPTWRELLLKILSYQPFKSFEWEE